MILDKIQEANDIKKLKKAELAPLAGEIREFILDKVSKTGGHLASNLGTIEITMALHRCMNFPEDKLIFDVGHQCYTHKLLTGRKDGFDTLRQMGGMSGFPKRDENEADAFDTGHSSTSISAAMGFMKGRELRGSHERIAAVIGDGSMTGGMFYEAINQIGQMKGSVVIVLNDNEMSISKNVGSMSRALNRIRVGEGYNDLKKGVEKKLMGIPDIGEAIAKKIKRQKDNLKNFLVPGHFVEELGITYIGPVDGHNIDELEGIFERAFRLGRPILVHVKTKKGKGYAPAEKYPTHFHGVGPFDPKTGKDITPKKGKTYTDVFSEALVDIGTANEKIVAITAAMSRGTGVHEFKKRFPDRTVDVGIAEEHAVTFAAGLAASGYIPVVAIYSSFLQRAYDQILHDVCLQNLHVVFAIDRSGIVPGDGSTHQGIYDTAYLSDMPNLTMIAPKNAAEITAAMKFAVDSCTGPVAIKYAKGTAYTGGTCQGFGMGVSDRLYPAGDIDIIAVGNMVEQAVYLRAKLENDAGIKTGLVNARFIKPLDLNMVKNAAEGSRMLVIMEEAVRSGSVGDAVAAYLFEKGISTKLLHFYVNKDIIQHGSVEELRKDMGLDVDSMYVDVVKSFKS
ncbi:MAG: 1-deoxy-D-xylulose-5-phosphate synthase [Eubacterium sp.]|nr:1-deoxy-D-xylulose-5-phosphate synthase [Eubacterium sp.]